MKKSLSLSMAVIAASMSITAWSYDGTHCKEPGVCWEPKPGYPDQVAGSKYDPKHDVNELNKQAQSIKEMEARNEKRWRNFTKSGKFVYDVEEIAN
ncbi:MAG: methanol dehydrogenase [cytochrome c] subunit [Methylovulum sp.]|nr:methanol dehydrogenase [cytochrome c] subunit [Methylovulum sp.]